MEDDSGVSRVSLSQSAVTEFEETDVATTNRIVDWHANPSASRNIDPNLKANDLVHVARHGDDISETQLIVKGPDADGNLVARWLEAGDLEEGWTHIEARHIEGTYQVKYHGSGDPWRSSLANTTRNGGEGGIEL
ncbi:hypothetical protein [Natronorubrum sp. A-ect3]|uniref:hypothetical protein n=1 Tax=Natronorubrum sp. A-ect3 TaxID=3242698 RepID=UPI00359D8AB7